MNTDERCPICHTPWPEHDGPTRLCAKLREVTGHLNAVDAMLAGRDALDDKPDRVAKILHAINTARKADPLTAERDAAIRATAEEGRLRGKAEAEVARLRASEATWQECAGERGRKVERLSAALRGVLLLKQLGGMLPGPAEIVRSVVEEAEAALEETR